MALPASAQKASYPLAAYNFRVTVAGTAMSFTEVSGLAATYAHAVYRHGLSFTEGEQIVTFEADRFAPLTCKRGVILGKTPLFLFDWLRAKELRSMEVHLCDETGTPALTWKIAHAVPVSLKAPTLAATSNEAAVDTLELQVRGVSLVER